MLSDTLQFDKWRTWSHGSSLPTWFPWRRGGPFPETMSQGLLYHKLRDQPLTPLKASVFLTLHRKLRKHTALCCKAPVPLYSLFSPRALAKAIHATKNYIPPNMCSLHSYFHTHNINIPDAKNRGYYYYKIVSLPCLC